MVVNQILPPHPLDKVERREKDRSKKTENEKKEESPELASK